MAAAELELRVAALEAEVARLKEQVEEVVPSQRDWLSESMATSETAIKLESRVAILEAKVIQLRRRLEAVVPEARPWWEYVVGAFADDPDFEEATRLGREYRESLGPRRRPKATREDQVYGCTGN